MHSPYFPPTDPQSDASLPSTWSGRVPCPRFRGTIKALRLPAALPAALRCLRLAVPRRRALRFAPTTPRRNGGGPGVLWVRRPPLKRRMSRWRRQDLPSSRETPIAHSPCSSTPAGLHTPYRNGAAARPPLRERRGLPHWDFRGSIAWLLGSLSTLRRVGRPTTTPDSLPGAGKALLGGLGYPQGLAERFPSCCLHLIPLSRA